MHESRHQSWGTAFSLAIAIVFSSRQHPWSFCNVGHAVVKLLREIGLCRSLLAQHGVECYATHRCDCHSLPVDWVECAECITKNYKVFWLPFQCSELTQTVVG